MAGDRQPDRALGFATDSTTLPFDRARKASCNNARCLGAVEIAEWLGRLVLSFAIEWRVGGGRSLFSFAITFLRF